VERGYSLPLRLYGACCTLKRRPASIKEHGQGLLDIALAQELDGAADDKDSEHLADEEQHIPGRVEIVEVREDIVPDQCAHELVVVDQVDAQHRPGDAVNRCAEEIRPRQEVKEQRDGQRNRQDHGQAGRFLQEGILMQQKPHCIKRQYRCEHEQDHRKETAQVAFMLPRRPQRCTMQPQITANSIDKDEEQDRRIREERHDLECRQYRIAQEEQGQEQPKGV
jgi:hypothetical protein